MDSANRDKIVGTTIDRRYRVLRAAGEGRLSSVFEADDLERQYTVALKFLNEGIINKKAFEQYRIAVESAKVLVHPNIVRVFSCEVTSEGDPYVVTDFVKATTNLAKLLYDKKPLPEDTAISIMAQVCDALDHAHSKGIVHANLKPSNIMLIDAHGGSYMVKVADFGTLPQKSAAGKMPQADTRYQSVEQSAGQRPDSRADLYAVGCLLFQCLVGTVPPGDKGATNASNDSTAQKQIEPPIPTLSGTNLSRKVQLQAILDRALAKKPTERYQRASELGGDLSLLLELPPEAWALKAAALQPIVPLKVSSPAIIKIPDLRLPIAIAAGLIAIPLSALVGISVMNVKVEALMPYELAIQEKVFAPTDPRLIKNTEDMIEYYKSQRKYAEAWAYKAKIMRPADPVDQSGDLSADELRKALKL